MNYARIQNNQVAQYPVNPMIEHPSVSFPINWGGGNIDGIDYVRVEDVPFPTVGNYQKISEQTPINDKGVWKRSFIVVNMTAEEKAALQAQMWESIRNERDQKLQSCDWTQLGDVPLTDNQKQQWIVYRQQLRDITNQTNDPALVEWPIPPVVG